MHINVAASAVHHGAPLHHQQQSPVASRRTVSLPPGHAVFDVGTQHTDTLGRLFTPLATLRNLSSHGAHAPGEARALAGAQQLVSVADTLMAELVAHEHARQQADAAAEAAQEEQAKDFARLDKLTYRCVSTRNGLALSLVRHSLADVDEAFATCTDELDALLQRKLQLLDSVGDAEEQAAGLERRLQLQQDELSNKCDVIVSLKASLYLALEEQPEAMNDPNVAACFSAEF